MKNPENLFKANKQKEKGQFISLSRDYHIYAAFILLIALLSSILSAVKLYNSKQSSLKDQLITQSKLIDTQFSNYLNYVSHIAEDKGHKIALTGGKDLENISYLFKRNFFFDVTKLGLQQKAFTWPHFSWIDKKGNILVKSEFGVLTNPQKAKDSKVLYQSTIDNWQLHLSNPYQDIFSDKIFIDGYLGISDIESEEYIGSIGTKFDIKKLVSTIRHNLKGTTQFIILNEELKIIIQSNNVRINDENFFVNKLTNIDGELEFILLDDQLKYRDDIYKIYQKSANYPFIILTGYDSKVTNKEFIISLIGQIIEVFGAAFFILIILFFQRQRIIKPINILAKATRKISQGAKDIKTLNKDNKSKYPFEIYELNESILLTKRLLEEEKKGKKIAQDSSEELTKLKDRLEKKNELAKKSKESREKFLTEIRKNTIEDGIRKITVDLAKVLNHEQGNVIMTKNAVVELHKRMLDRCAKILSYVSDSLDLSDVNIPTLIKEAIDMNSHDADLNNVKLIFESKGKIADIYVDKRSIKHVIFALIHYAMEDRKRNIKDSFVKITAKSKTEKSQEFLQIIFEDNGHGISEEMRMNFEQDAQKNNKDNNMALSLYAIRYILTLHKASLEIKNNAGKGSKMVVEIPYETQEVKETKDDIKPKKPLKKIDNIIELFPKK